jgi:hypothetical protein
VTTTPLPIPGPAAGAVPPPVPPSSRYAPVGTAVHVAPDGRELAYLRRRFVPQPEALATVAEHTVAEAERLDAIAARAFGDPTQFWRLCDANLAMRPAELEEPGRVLRVTLPEGIPGAGDG